MWHPRSETAYYRAVYRQIRREVQGAVEDARRRELSAPLSIRDIDDAALDYVDNVWVPSHPGPPEPGNFAWRQGLKHFGKKVDYLCAAYWSGNVLCGLMLGKPSEKRRHVSIYMIEGLRFAPNPLKGFVLPLAIDTGEAYAQALEAEYLRLVSPLESMLPRYCEEGFEHFAPGNAAPYCERRL